jgi:hypothetical protein
VFRLITNFGLCLSYVLLSIVCVLLFLMLLVLRIIGVC